MIATYGPRRIEGYAIISEDGMLANAARIMPDSLKFEAGERPMLDPAKALQWLAGGVRQGLADNACANFKCGTAALLGPCGYVIPVHQRFARDCTGYFGRAQGWQLNPAGSLAVRAGSSKSHAMRIPNNARFAHSDV